jgi:hypothetical protein
MARIEDALQEALAAMAQGRPVDEVLTNYPELAGELRSLIAAARSAESLAGPPNPTGPRHRSRARLQTALSAMPAASAGPARIRRTPRLALAGLALVLAVCGASIGLSEAAANSLPGDLLFGAKLAAQHLRLRLASLPQTRQALEVRYAEQRVDEVRSLLLLGRTAPVAFEGEVDSLSSEIWEVSGILVRRRPDTRVVGEVAPGMVVWVAGFTQADGTVLADELRLRAYDATGVIESIDSRELVLDGSTLRLTEETVLGPGVTAGVRVRVRVKIADDGGLVAVDVVLLSPATPSPAPVEPTSIPPTKIEATEEREPTETAEPTEAETEDHGDGENATAVPEATETHEAEHDGEDDEGFKPSEIEFKGAVQSISGSLWVVAGKTLSVTGETEIRDNPGVGDRVKVVAWIQENGDLWAERIELDD